MDAEALILLCPALVALSGLYAIWFGVVYAVKFEGDRIRVRYPIRSDVVPYSAVASWRREKHIGYSWRRTTLWYFEFQVFDRAGTVLTRFHVSLAEGAEIARQIAAKTGIAEYQDS